MENPQYVLIVGRWHAVSEPDKKKIDTLIKDNTKILLCVVNTPPTEKEPSTTDEIVQTLHTTFKEHIESGNITIQTIPKINNILYEKGYRPSNVVTEQIFYVIKAFSWRAIGTLDTILLAWLITGNPLTGLTIGAYEFVTKTTLYYIHDLIWDKCIIRLSCCRR
jgi:uncharacterized membrane protein